MRILKMSETKRYYWLKLPENFFDATDDETISFIEEQEGGSAYVLFYLKLLCKALRTDGTLIRLIGNRYVLTASRVLYVGGNKIGMFHQIVKYRKCSCT